MSDHERDKCQDGDEGGDASVKEAPAEGEEAPRREENKDTDAEAPDLCVKTGDHTLDDVIAGHVIDNNCQDSEVDGKKTSHSQSSNGNDDGDKESV